MTKPRKNVKVIRVGPRYMLYGIDGKFVLGFDAEKWRALGLRPIRSGAEFVVDLQVSGVPKKRRKARG